MPSFSVGYYSNLTDALNESNLISSSNSYTLATVGGYSNWIIASNSTGTSSQFQLYSVGTVLNSDGVYYVYEQAKILYVSVGSNSDSSVTIVRSSDGSNWNPALTDPFPGGVGYGVAYNQSNLWVAVGKNSNNTVTVVISRDGLFWNTVDPDPLSGGWANGIAYNGSNLWCVVGKNFNQTTIAYSSNGSNWVAASTNPFGDGDGYGIAWNGSYWCAVGEVGKGSTIALSSDASTWTLIDDSNDPFYGGMARGIAWNGLIWVAVGRTDTGSETAATSSNGSNWSYSTNNPFPGGTAYGIAWNGSFWVAVGQASDTSSISTSSNGSDWIASTDPFTGGEGYGISWNGSIWVAVGYNSNNTQTIATSLDGLTWTPSPSNPFTSGIGYGIATFYSITPVLSYYSNVTDALAQSNLISSSYSYTLETAGGYSNWIIAANSTGTSSQSQLYSAGTLLNRGGKYYVYQQPKILYVSVGVDGNSLVTAATSSDGSNWNPALTDPFIGGRGLGVAYNQSNLWVAVGYNSNNTVTVAISTEGLFWNTVDSDPFPGGEGYGIAWNGSYWCAVGFNSNISVTAAISSNGFDWTPSSVFPDGTARAVAWNGSYWLAVGGGMGMARSVARSSDGLLWISSLGDLFPGGIAYGVAWNGFYWCAVGFGIDGDSSVSIAISVDGSNWSTSINNPFTDRTAYGVAWNGYYWCAVGYNTDFSVTAAISSNGLNWTTSSPIPGGTGFGISWNRSIWVVVGASMGQTIATSADGSNWTPSVNDPFTVGSALGIATFYSMTPKVSYYSNVTDALSQSNLITSSYLYILETTGGYSNWIIASNSTGSSSQFQLYSSGTVLHTDGVYYVYQQSKVLYVSVGYSGDYSVAIVTSSDGSTWNPALTDPFIGGIGGAVAYNQSNLWVAVGYNSGYTGIVATSPEGLFWTSSGNNPFPGGLGKGIAWNGSYWCAVGLNSNSSVSVATSSDGSNWTASLNNPFPGGIGRGVAWNGSYWCAVGNVNNASRIATSENGSNWTVIPDSETLFPDGWANGIAWNGLIWVVVGYIDGGIQSVVTSSNGSNWSYSTNNPFPGGKANGIAWNGSYWCAVGTDFINKTISTSSNGSNWSISPSSTDPFVGGEGYGISWNGSMWVAVGYNSTQTETIATSPDGSNWTLSLNNPFTSGIAYGIATFYSTTLKVSYYSNVTDALAQSNVISSSYSYILETAGGYSNWIIASNSTGTSSKIRLYSAGTVLNLNGIYYVYLATSNNYHIIYYSSSESAQHSGGSILDESGSSVGFTVSNLYGVSNWTGFSGLSYGISFTAGDIVPTSLYSSVPLYPTYSNYVFYYSQLNSNLFSLNNIYTIDKLIVGLTASYTVISAGGYSFWNIASNTSTGSSSQTVSYTVGNILSNDGTYYLYPSFVVAYYSNLTDALAHSNLISSSYSYTLTSAGGYSNWILASNSTGTSSQFQLYSSGTLLNSNGAYYVYQQPKVLYVSVGQNLYSSVTAATSSDGSNWNPTITNPFTGGSGRAVAYNQSNLWVAVGNNTNGSVTVATSPEGLFWTSSGNNPFPGGLGKGIAWNGSYWCAVGLNSNSSVSVATSSDGSNWTPSLNNPFPGGFGYGVAWNGLYWCAVGETPGQPSTTSTIALSSNGSNWTIIPTSTDPFYGKVGNGISWNGSNWIAVGANSNNTQTIARSPDGSNWTYSTNNPFLDGFGRAIAWNGSYWCAVGVDDYNYIIVAISSDGLAWTSSSLFTGGSGFGISWNGSIWVAVGNFIGQTIATSPDGSNWTLSVNNPFIDGQAYGIATVVPIPPTLSYYSNITDALTQSNLISSSYSYILETTGGYSNWILASNSTGTSSKIRLYSSGTVLNSNGSYYVYPATSNAYEIFYYSSQQSAQYGDISMLNESGSSITFTVSNLYGVSNWSFFSGYYPGTVVTAGDIVPTGIFPSTYILLYPTYSNYVFYYSQSNPNLFSLNNIYAIDNLIVGLTDSYTVISAGGYSFWNIASNSSTGSSSQTVSYTVGNILLNDGTYYLYPSFVVAYYSNVTDSLAQSNLISSSYSYTLESAGGYSNWILASNSTGTSSQSQLYSSGTLLNSNGAYYVYQQPKVLYVSVGQNLDSSVTAATSSDGSNWNPVLTDPFIGGRGRGVAYNQSNLWVAVGKNSNNTVTVAISTGGLFWTYSESDPFAGGEAYGIAYNGSYWCAVGFNSNFSVSAAISSNGFDWTPSSPFPDLIGYGVAWNGSYWLAVCGGIGATQTIASSPDGLLWSPSLNNPFTGGGASGVAWNGSYWCVVGNGIDGESSVSIAISVDGSNWSNSTNNPFTDGTAYGVAWNGYYWCAVGYNTSFSVTAATSSNGLNWITFSPFPGGIGNGISWNGSMWVAVGTNSNQTQTIATSPDGSNWTPSLNNPFTDGSGYGIATLYSITSKVSYYSNVTDALAQSNLISSSYSYILESAGGYSNWIIASNSTGTSSQFQLYSSGTLLNTVGVYYVYQQPKVLYVSVGTSIYHLVTAATSSDGSNWNATITNPFTGGVGYGVAYNQSNLWVAVGINSQTQTIATSPDGLFWTASESNPFSGGSAYGIAWNGSYWCAVGADDNAYITAAISSNGFTWTASLNNPFPAGAGYGIAWNGSYWCAVGQASHTSTIALSSNGSNWTIIPSSTDPFYGRQARGIAWNGSYWVAVGNNSNNTQTIATSTDGSNWSYSTNNPFPGGSGRAIAWNGSYWCAVGYDEYTYITAAISSNGLTWTTSYPFIDGVGYGIAWNGSNWIAVGYNSNHTQTIATSPDGSNWTPSLNNPFINGEAYGIATFVPIPSVAVSYYSNLTDALAKSNLISSSYSYTLATAGGYSNWILASNSTGTSSQFQLYSVGTVLNSDGFYHVYQQPKILYVSVGSNSDSSVTIVRSSDGSTWNPALTDPFPGGVGYGVAYNQSNLWVAVGKNNNNTVTVVISRDGLFWNTVDPDPLSGGWANGIAYNGSNLWCVVGKNFDGTTIAYSSNGSNWIAASTNPFGDGDGYGIAWNGSYWCAVGEVGKGSTIALSSDASTWTLIDDSNDPFYGGMARGIAWNGLIWVAVGRTDTGSETAATSSNGSNWSYSTNNPFPGGTAYGIAWNGYYWCAVGQASDTSSISTSSNGSDWIASTDPFTGGEGYGISWNGSIWVAVGYNSNNTQTIATSLDGLTWTPSLSNPFTSGIGYGIATFYSTTLKVSYYSNLTDALAQSNLISSSYSYTLETAGGYSNWIIAANSTGSSSKSRLYSAGTVLNLNGTYYVYPASSNDYTIAYFSCYESAVQNVMSMFSESGSSIGVTVSNLYGVSNWTFHSLPYPGTVVRTGDILATDIFTYTTISLYPTYSNYVFYYSESNINLFTTGGKIYYIDNLIIGLTDSYTVISAGGYSFWNIGSISTGSSSQTVSYTVGDTLSNDGTYYLYPSFVVSYYSNVTDALAQSNLITSSYLYTLETVGEYSNWILASNSTGTSSQFQLYSSGTLLNSDGLYYVYQQPKILYVSVGYSGYSSVAIVTSSDESTWNPALTNPFTGGSGRAVAYNQSNLWVAVGNNSNNTATVTISSDGLFWNTVDPDPLSGGWAYGIAYNGLIWVAVGTNSNSLVSAATSPDGSNWTPSLNNPFPNGSARGVAWNGSYWCAVGTAIGQRIATSSDGSNWTLITSSSTLFPSGGANGIAWNGSYWVVVGNGEDAVSSIATSPDGSNWTLSLDNPFPNGRGYGIAWNGAYWCAVGVTPGQPSSTSTIALSSNGSNWTIIPTSTDPFYGGAGYGIAWNGSNWIAVGYNSNQTQTIARSPDGSNWTPSLNNPFTEGYGRGIAAVYFIGSNVNYYSNVTDALAQSNLITSSYLYTIITAGGYSNWFISSNSTGVSSQTVSYSVGDTLSNYGTYYLYPAFAIGYCSNLTDALAQSNLITSSYSYTVETAGGYSNWIISPNSTGTSSKFIVYSSGSLLNSQRQYFLYPVPSISNSYSIFYYSSLASAIQDTSYMLVDNIVSSNFTISNVNGISNWTVQSGYSSQLPTRVSSGDIVPVSILTDIYLHLYPTYSNNVFYYSQSNYYLFTRDGRIYLIDNFITKLTASYTVLNVGGISNWSIASSSTGSSSQAISYAVGDSLSNDGIYYLYPTPTFIPTVFYFGSQREAIATYNKITSSDSYTVVTAGGYSSWLIASNSTGTSSQTTVWQAGSNLFPMSNYYLYPYIPCFLEGTKILCMINSNEEYVPIEDISSDTLVKTSLDGYKKVKYIGYSTIQNYKSTDRFENRLYIYKKDVYPSLNEDLILTGSHSILVDSITEEEREQTMKTLGDIFITGNKYRLMAFLDNNSQPWASEGRYTVWHLALDNTDISKNYGIYANGLLVESASIRSLRDKSNMIFV